MNVASMSVSAGGVSASSGSRIGYHIGIADEILLGNACLSTSKLG